MPSSERWSVLQRQVEFKLLFVFTITFSYHLEDLGSGIHRNNKDELNGLV